MRDYSMKARESARMILEEIGEPDEPLVSSASSICYCCKRLLPRQGACLNAPHICKSCRYHLKKGAKNLEKTRKALDFHLAAHRAERRVKTEAK